MLACVVTVASTWELQNIILMGFNTHQNKSKLKPGTELVVWLIQKSSIVTYAMVTSFIYKECKAISEGR